MTDRARARRWIPLVVGALVVLGGLLVCTVAAGGVLAPDGPPSPRRSTAVTAAGHRYHLDCSAPAGGDGSPRRPWSSADDVGAHGAFQPDDSVLLRRGTVCSGRIVPSGSGRNGHPILLGAYGRGPRPVVNGGGTPDQTGTVELRDLHDWVVQDLAVTNHAEEGVDNTVRAGILVVNRGAGRLANIVVRRNHVSSVTSNPASYRVDPHSYGGVVVLVRDGADDEDTYDNVLLEDNEVAGVGRSGIVAWSSRWRDRMMTNVTVRGNTLDDVEGDSILLLGVDGGEIDHNISRGGGHLPECPRCTPTAYNTASAGIWPTRSRNIGIRYNEVSGEGAAGGDGEGIDIDEYTSDVVVEFNYTHDNDGGGILICGAQRADVRYNVFQHDAVAEIVFACPEQHEGIRIFNNDLVIAEGSTADVVRHAQGEGDEPVIFANNIVVNGGSGGYSWPAPALVTHNTYLGEHPDSEPYDTTRSETAGLVGAGSGSAGLESLAGYALEPGSPSAASGRNIDSGGTIDFFGRPFPADRPPRGAAGPGTDPPQPPEPERPELRSLRREVTVTWAPSAAATFALLRRDGADAPWRQIAAGLTGTRFDDLDLGRGAYSYRVVAEGAGGAGSPSAAATVRLR